MFIKFARLQEAEADHPTHAPSRHTDREVATTGTAGISGGGGTGGIMGGGGGIGGTGGQGGGIGIVGRRGMGVAYGADGKPVALTGE